MQCGILCPWPVTVNGGEQMVTWLAEFARSSSTPLSPLKWAPWEHRSVAICKHDNITMMSPVVKITSISVSEAWIDLVLANQWQHGDRSGRGPKMSKSSRPSDWSWNHGRMTALPDWDPLVEYTVSLSLTCGPKNHRVYMLVTKSRNFDCRILIHSLTWQCT